MATRKKSGKNKEGVQEGGGGLTGFQMPKEVSDKTGDNDLFVFQLL